ncbi:MAG: CCA tRNA nucleotidyltransferase [Sphingomonadales bacterium]
MRPSGGRLTQPWLIAPETTELVDALTARGATVRFVGGCVRDALIGRAVRDIDVATPDRPGTVIRLLDDAGIKTIPTGVDHGAVTAVINRKHFEITTLRRDVKTLGRRAEVAFVDDWAADARRRDFTFNALFCDPDGVVYDPTGGLKDLVEGRVRFIGDAEKRIIEDGLRILRFFRFHAWYGRGDMDGHGLAACRRRAGDILNLSAERIAGETERLLLSPDPVPTLRIMSEAGILRHVLAEARHFDRLDGLVTIEIETGRADPWRRLMALVEADEKGAVSLARRLRLANKIRDRLTAMAAAAPVVKPDDPLNTVRREIYRLGRERFIDQVMLMWAREPQQKGWLRLIEEPENWPRPKFPVTGDDVLALGVDQGRAVGKILRELEKWWMNNDFPPEDNVKHELRRQLSLADVTPPVA